MIDDAWMPCSIKIDHTLDGQKRCHQL